MEFAFIFIYSADSPELPFEGPKINNKLSFGSELFWLEIGT